MSIFDLNYNPFESTDEGDDFFAGLWSDRTENAYSDFFKGGGWKDWKEWINPGGVMANPAQQLADPGNFFTADEHKSWFGEGDPEGPNGSSGMSDRTSVSAIVAGLIYGGSALASSYGGEAAGAGGEIEAGTGLVSTGGEELAGAGGSGGFDFMDMLGSGMGGDSQGQETSAQPEKKAPSFDFASVLSSQAPPAGTKLLEDTRGKDKLSEHEFSFDFLL